MSWVNVSKKMQAADDMYDALRDVLGLYESAMMALKQTPAAFEMSREVVAARAALAKATKANE